MTKEKMQERLDKKEKSPWEMREIAEAYLRGDVLKDMVAAEGWLMKVIETEDTKEAPCAMALIARNILGKEQVFSDEDYLKMKEDLKTAKVDERKELEELLSFATVKQKRL